MGCCVFKEQPLTVKDAISIIETELDSLGVDLNEEMSSDRLKEIALALSKNKDPKLWDSIKRLV